MTAVSSERSGASPSEDDAASFVRFMRAQLSPSAQERVSAAFGALDQLPLGRAIRAFYWATENAGYQADPAIIPIFDGASDATRLNASSAKYYIQDGLVHGMALRRVIESRAGKAGLDILDFGCGSGRLLWVMRQFAPGHRYSACDVNGDAVEMISRSFPEVRTKRIEGMPPTGFSGEQFDVVYAWSIFTHYGEEAHRQWLAELLRIVRPGGLLMLTVKSEHRVRQFFDEPKFDAQLKLSNLTREQALARYDQHGYLYLRAYSEARAKAAGIDPETFGNTLISRDYIRRTWPAYGDIVDILPVAPQFQDLVVLRRKR